MGLGGEGMRRVFLLIGALCMLSLSGVSLAAVPKPATRQSQRATPDANVAELRALLQTPESRIDLAKAKLAIDRMIDPKVAAAGTGSTPKSRTVVKGLRTSGLA